MDFIKKNSDKLYNILLLSIFLLFFIRMINLDADLPPLRLLDYSSVDEGIYGNLALNKINYGFLNPNTFFNYNLLEISPQTIINLFGNLLIYISMFLFGDNYYGFRLPIILICFVSLIIIFKCMCLIENEYARRNRKLKLIIITLFLTSFQFYNTSRIVEPTAFRLISVAIVIYIFLKFKHNNTIRSILLGFISTISIFLIYINNSFLLIGFALYLLCVYKKNKKEVIESLVYGSVGIILAILISSIYYWLWGTNIINNSISLISSFQTNSMYSFSKTISFSTYFERIFRFLSSNLFFYMCPIIVIIVINLKCIMQEIIGKNKNIIFYISLIVAFVFQTIVSEDFVNRKSIVLIPIIVCLIFEIFIIRREKVLKDIPFYNVFICILILLILYYYKFMYYPYADFNNYDIASVFIFYICPSLVFLISHCILKNNSNKISVIYVCAIILGNIMFTYRYNFRNVNFSERNAMIELSKYNNEFILGEYENGFTLYNDFLPVLDTRENILTLMKTGEYKYYFDYSNVDEFLKAEFPGITLEKEFIVTRNFPNQYGNNDMCVYKIIVENEK